MYTTWHFISEVIYLEMGNIWYSYDMSWNKSDYIWYTSGKNFSPQIFYFLSLLQGILGRISDDSDEKDAILCFKKNR